MQPKTRKSNFSLHRSSNSLKGQRWWAPLCPLIPSALFSIPVATPSGQETAARRNQVLPDVWAHMSHRDYQAFDLGTGGGRFRSHHKFDVDDAEPPINGADHENGSASGSEPKKMKVAKSPPASAGSRKRRGSAPRESSGSDHPPPSRKAKKIQRQDEEDDEVASDVSTPRHKSGDENTKGDEDQTSPKILVFPPEIPTQLETPVRYRHLSAAALAALAVITDSVENNNDISLDLKHTAIIFSPSTSRKSPVHEPPLLATLRHVRELHHPTTWIETKDLPSLIPSTEARERRDAHLQDLRSPRMIGGSLSNHQFGHPTRSSPSTSRYRVG
jgi:hypothetical protein